MTAGLAQIQAEDRLDHRAWLGEGEALETLDAALLAAHVRHDTEALVRLYTIAGDAAEARHDHDAAAFYLTHAFVFALEAGAPDAVSLNRRLAARGRTHLLEF